MDNLNVEIKDIFATFRTDIPGIRVKKLLRLVRTVQASITDIEKTQTKSIDVLENGYSILVSPCKNHWQLTIGEAAIELDKDNVYDSFGNVLPCKDVAPLVIQTILSAA